MRRRDRLVGWRLFQYRHAFVLHRLELAHQTGKQNRFAIERIHFGGKFAPVEAWHAANGDQLYATFKGFLSTTSEPGVLTFDNPAPVVGGTGRFLGAEGVLRARGIVNINDGSFESRVEGYLLLPK